MHTAFQLSRAMFDVRRHGVGGVGLLDGWQPGDRLGVVVDAPLGALGASFLIQLAIVAYFDVKPARRTTQPSYAEVFLLHVGGRFGSFAGMDIWPPRKEVFVEGADGLLGQINNLGITYLALPAARAGDHLFPYKEPAAALDRLRACFCYAADGDLADGDVTIAVTDDAPLSNVRAVIDPDILFAGADNWRQDTDPARLSDKRRFFDLLAARRGEVGVDERERCTHVRRALIHDGATIERYRSIVAQEALAIMGGLAG